MCDIMQMQVWRPGDIWALRVRLGCLCQIGFCLRISQKVQISCCFNAQSFLKSSLRVVQKLKKDRGGQRRMTRPVGDDRKPTVTPITIAMCNINLWLQSAQPHQHWTVALEHTARFGSMWSSTEAADVWVRVPCQQHETTEPTGRESTVQGGVSGVTAY